MATAMTGKLLALRDEVVHFAEEHIATRPDLSTASEFPWDIWQAMGRAGLLGLGLPEEYSGRGGGYLAVAVAGETLVRSGGSMGLALSVVMHHVVSQFLILGFGSSRQRREYLPAMAAGRMTGCLALSEPETGAHPRHIKTTAVREGDFYRLDGEKTYLTNGPIADVFVVIAVTGVEGDRKRLTTFLVPKDTPGLAQTKPMRLDFLRPSPHGGIKLDSVKVPGANILGQEGQAFETIGKPFREVEDALLMGPLAGGAARQLELVASLINQQGIRPTDELKAGLGNLQAVIHTLRVMAYEASQMLDDPFSHPEFQSLLLLGRDFSQRFQSELEALIASSGIKLTSELSSLTKDLTLSGGLAKNVALIKQMNMGQALLKG